jgi:hypothetical protein
MSWDLIGNTNTNSGSSTSDLIKLENGKRIRLLLPTEGPTLHWTRAISTPSNDYRTWVTGKGDEDFFSINDGVFRPRPVFVGYAWDYSENKVGILEAGNQIWESILVLHKAGKDLNGRDIIINVKGEKRSTEYTVVDSDPSPFPYDTQTLTYPDITARYLPVTKESVLLDLKEMGFTNPEELFTPKTVSFEEAKHVKVTFGKHKDKTLEQVYQQDSQYILFLATKIDRMDIKESAKVVANQLLGTSFESQGVCPSVNQVAFSKVASGSTPPAPSTGGAMTRPTNPAFIDNSTGKEMWWTGTEWIEAVIPPAPPVPTPPAPPAPPAPPVELDMPQRPTDEQFIYKNPTDGSEMWWIDGVWIKPPAVVAPPAPMAPPAPTPPAPPAPPTPSAPVAPPAPTGGDIKSEINSLIEGNPKFQDFQEILNAMRSATAPNYKTSIDEFTQEELEKMKAIVSQ